MKIIQQLPLTVWFLREESDISTEETTTLHRLTDAILLSLSYSSSSIVCLLLQISDLDFPFRANPFSLYFLAVLAV